MSKPKSTPKPGANRSREERVAEVRKAKQREERQRRLIMIGSILAGLAIIIAAVVVIQQQMDTTGDKPDSVPTVASDPASEDAIPGELDGYGIFVGDSDAPTTVTIYEDMQCPACSSFEAQVGEPLRAAVEDGRVRVEYRLVSFLDGASTNKYSSRALNAGLVVLEQAGVDAFLTFHDDLFANQPREGGAGYSDDQLVERAVAAGADADAIRDDIESMKYEQWIVNATDQMSKDGVRGTPHVKIDGEDAEPSELLPLIQ